MAVHTGEARKGGGFLRTALAARKGFDAMTHDGFNPENLFEATTEFVSEVEKVESMCVELGLKGRLLFLMLAYSFRLLLLYYGSIERFYFDENALSKAFDPDSGERIDDEGRRSRFKIWRETMRIQIMQLFYDEQPVYFSKRTEYVAALNAQKTEMMALIDHLYFVLGKRSGLGSNYGRRLKPKDQVTKNYYVDERDKILGFADDLFYLLGQFSIRAERTIGAFGGGRSTLGQREERLLLDMENKLVKSKDLKLWLSNLYLI